MLTWHFPTPILLTAMPKAPCLEVHSKYYLIKMKFSFALPIIFFWILATSAFAAIEQPERVPLFPTLFHQFGWNALGAFTYGYGAHWALGAAGTYGLVESGADWKWNRFCVRHEALATWATLPGGVIGSLAPFIVPLSMYWGSDSREIQIAGIAVGQAAILGFGVTSFVKIFTGRTPPHVADAADGDKDYQKDYSGDFKWGIWRGGIFDGWPSGHTATAVAMATTLATLYPENAAIRIGAIAYSLLIGVSMSFMAHWESDIFAGALVGFAIGRTVGKSFANLRDGKSEDRVSFYFYPNGAGIAVRF